MGHCVKGVQLQAQAPESHGKGAETQGKKMGGAARRGMERGAAE